MRIYWGVDSFRPASSVITTPRRFVNEGEPREQTLFEYVTRRVRQPDFWGRYLNRGDSSLSAEEARYIFTQSNGGCRILPVYNGPHRHSSDLIGPGAAHHGRRAAEMAIGLARSQGISNSTRIYADLERWLALPEWFRGWFEAMYTSEFPAVGGLYGNPVASSRIEGWRRGFVRAASDFSNQHFDELIESIVSERTFKSTRAYLWANRDYLTQPGQDPALQDMVQTHFTPRLASYDFVSETVIWQYSPNVPLGYSRPLVDLNICKQQAYNEMWAR